MSSASSQDMFCQTSRSTHQDVRWIGGQQLSFLRHHLHQQSTSCLQKCKGFEKKNSYFGILRSTGFTTAVLNKYLALAPTAQYTRKGFMDFGRTLHKDSKTRKTWPCGPNLESCWYGEIYPRVSWCLLNVISTNMSVQTVATNWPDWQDLVHQLYHTDFGCWFARDSCLFGIDTFPWLPRNAQKC